MMEKLYGSGVTTNYCLVWGGNFTSDSPKNGVSVSTPYSVI